MFKNFPFNISSLVSIKKYYKLMLKYFLKIGGKKQLFLSSNSIRQRFPFYTLFSTSKNTFFKDHKKINETKK